MVGTKGNIVLLAISVSASPAASEFFLGGCLDCIHVPFKSNDVGFVPRLDTVLSSKNYCSQDENFIE